MLPREGRKGPLLPQAAEARGEQGSSEEIEKVLNCHASGADQGAKRPAGKLSMLGNGKIGADPRLHHNRVAAHLPDLLPSGVLEGFRRFFA